MVTVAVSMTPDTAPVAKQLYDGAMRAVDTADLTNEIGHGFYPRGTLGVDWSCLKVILSVKGAASNYPIDSIGWLVPPEDAEKKYLFEAIHRKPEYNGISDSIGLVFQNVSSKLYSTSPRTRAVKSFSAPPPTPPQTHHHQ